MHKLKNSLLCLVSLLIIGFFCTLFVYQFGQEYKINNKLQLGLFSVHLIGFLIILGFYNFTKYKEIGFVFLGLVVFKFFAVAFLFYQFKPDFVSNTVVYFVFYWIYLTVDMFLVLRLLKKQD